MDELLYLKRQKEEQDKYEALCKRCGSCCGVFDGDPCVHLLRQGPERYICAVYENRFGNHSTVSGKRLSCVTIRELYSSGLPFSGCAYAHFGK